MWSVEDTGGAVHLLASDGEYLSEARSTVSDFKSIGVPLRIDSETSSVQFVLLPSDQLDVSNLVSAGFTNVSGALYATSDTADEYEVIELGNPTARGAAPVEVPMFIPPTF